MEATLAWAGMWTAVTIGMLLLIPIVLEFCKRNVPICVGIVLTLISIYTLTPYSPEARNAWGSITHYPENVWHSINALVG
jgi:hypothetical protein